MTVQELKQYISFNAPMCELLPYIYMTTTTNTLHASFKKQKEYNNIFFNIKQINHKTLIKGAIHHVDNRIIREIKPKWFEIKYLSIIYSVI